MDLSPVWKNLGSTDKIKKFDSLMGLNLKSFFAAFVFNARYITIVDDIIQCKQKISETALFFKWCS